MLLLLRLLLSFGGGFLVASDFAACTYVRPPDFVAERSLWSVGRSVGRSGNIIFTIEACGPGISAGFMKLVERRDTPDFRPRARTRADTDAGRSLFLDSLKL